MDFACKKFDLDEVVRCGLNLTKAEFRIFEFLIKSNAEKISSEIIAKKLDLDLSTVQRSMKKMTEKKIVTRTQFNLEGGGYTFAYCICNKQAVKETLMSIINNWTIKFETEIEKW